MKYTIPKNKTTQDKEWRRIFLSVTGLEACHVDKAIKFIYTYSADSYEFNSDKSYQELLDLYKIIGIAGNDDTIYTFFKTKERDADNFNYELQDLWSALQLHVTKDGGYSLQATYQMWKKDIALENPVYKPKLIELSNASEQENARDEENDKQGIEQKKTVLRLVDKDSPYYEYVAGTVYEEMYNLYASIKADADPSLKGTTLLLEDMEQLLYKMQLHYIQHNNQGSHIPMTIAERREITALHEKCITALSRVQTDWNILDERNNLNALLVKNRNRLAAISVLNIPPLANVLRSTQIPTITLADRSKNKVGDAMSTREAVEYTDEYGIMHRGFFTEENTAELETLIDLIIEPVAKEHPAYEKDLRRLLPANDSKQLYNNVVSIIKYHKFMARKKTDAAAKSLKAFVNSPEWIYAGAKNDKDLEKVFSAFAKNVFSSVNELDSQIVLADSGIKSGDELSRRASAMSDVAMALGFSDLLVESRRVTVKIGDKEVKGVMMEGASPDMKDPAYMTNTDPFYSKQMADQLDSEAVLSSFANLQILDFICGNTDRHYTNFLWKQDLSDPKNPKLLGVQGIDNDNSFGAITDGGTLKLAYHDNLKIITPKMAKAVENLSCADLRNLLKPYAFKKEQVEAAEKRLELLQNMIKNGKDKDLQFYKGRLVNEENTIHIVKNDEWKYLDANRLVPTGGAQQQLKDGTVINNANIFGIPAIYHYIVETKENKNTNNKAPITYSRQIAKEPAKPAPPVLNYKALSLALNKEAQKFESIRKTLYDKGGNTPDKRSAEFKIMYQALEKHISSYSELQKTLNEEKRDLVKEASLARFYDQMNTNQEELNTVIDNYLGKYRFHTSRDNQSRIDAARELKTYLSTERASQKIYSTYMKKKSDYNNKYYGFTMEKGAYTPGQDFKLADNALNQILGTMKFTMTDNLNTLPENSELRGKGVKVITNLERLWNYSMDSANDSVASVKAPENNNDASLEQLKNDIGKKSNAKLSSLKVKQIKNLLKEMLAYEKLVDKKYPEEKVMPVIIDGKAVKPAPPTLTEILENLVKEDNQSISPDEIRNVLHNLYSRELAIAKRIEAEKNFVQEYEKFSIPEDKALQDREWHRILLSTEGYEAGNVDKIIRFIYTHAAASYKYNPDSSYQELLDLYKEAGIAGEKATIDTFFVNKPHNADNYKAELQTLWGTMLLLSSEDRRYNIRVTYERWKADTALPPDKRVYAPRLTATALAHKDEYIQEKEKTTLPLIDKTSPYYEYVAGTVYEEMYNLYNNIKAKADNTLMATSILEEDMEQLLYKMQLHYIRRNNHGSLIPMTADERDEILELHNKCITSMSRINSEANLYQERPVLRQLLAKNRNALKALTVSKLPPLASVMRGTLKPTIELSELGQNKIGSINRREAIEYTDEYGVMHRGFFTEEKPVQTEALLHSGIQADDKLSVRASAMSEVALALGVPGLLVESRNVTVKVGEKTINGVMMEGAAPDMKDPAYITPDDTFFNEKIIKQLDSSMVLGSLADLQILDFICGNTDRHMNNYFWKQDLSNPDNPKLLGVQGIDNDTSFGTITDGGYMNLAYHDSLKIITPEMASAVEKLSIYDLRDLLEPYSLKKEQVAAAEKRLALLQTLIKNGRKDTEMHFDKNGKLINKEMSIHIIRNEDYKQLTIDKLTPDAAKKRQLADGTTIDNNNLFGMAANYKTAYSNKDFREQLFSKNVDKKAITYSNQKPKQNAPVPDYKALLTSHKAESQKLTDIRKTLYKYGGNTLNKRSEEFKVMYQELRKYISRYTELEMILNNVPASNADGLKKEMSLAKQYNDMAADRKKLDTLIDNYLNKYRFHTDADNHRRIDAARELKTYLSSVKESQTIYDNYKNAKAEYVGKLNNNNYNPVNDFKEAGNALNQIFGTMKFTLIDNLNSLPQNSSTYAKGVKAAGSLERLWNYSMNSVNQSGIAVKTPVKKEGMTDEQFAKEQAALKQLQKDIAAKKSIAAPDKYIISQFRDDLKAILEYETSLDKDYKESENPAFLKDLDTLINGGANAGKQNAINPAQVRNVLHNLYSREVAIAKKIAENKKGNVEKKEVKKEAPKKQLI